MTETRRFVRRRIIATVKRQADLQFSLIVFNLPLQEVDLLQELFLVKFELPHVCKAILNPLSIFLLQIQAG
jgi:hypothetical protein